LSALNQRNYNDNRLLKLVQTSTHNLMGSFRDKTELLIKCSNDIKLLIREGYERLFEIHRNTLLGLDELIRNLWTIIDSPRTDAKEKIKASTLMTQCYKERLGLVRSEPDLIQCKQHMDKIKMMPPL